ncbi:MAG: replicative DNA helicase [Alphaproteobacteria bacterium]|nr:replicative DNA helicase [Alphaproteobacteria bacterium]
MKQISLTQEAENFLKIPQFNIESEQLLLGGILLNNEIFNQVADFLKPEHFYEPLHRKLYSTCALLTDKGMSATVSSLDSILSRHEEYKNMSGREYISNLMTFAISVINYTEHAALIYDLSIKRDLISIGEEIVNKTYASNIDTQSSDLLEKAEASLFDLATNGISNNGFEKIAVSIREAIDRTKKSMKSPNHITGISTGFIDLDAKLFGFQDSDLVVLAGRPSMGKTALALNLALNAAFEFAKDPNAQTRKSVGLFSLEMSSEQLSTRILATHSLIDSSSLRSGRLKEFEFNKLQESANTLSDLPLFIDDTGMLSISAIRTRARRLKRKHNLGILFIDYLQLISSSSKKENRVQEISEITMSLKALAKELDIPIIALSQLSRSVESRDDKRPLLSDLRESGAIEQDADIVMFIYREEYYLSRKEPDAGTEKHSAWLETLDKVHNKAEVIVAKHRNGPIGQVALYYDGNYSRFANIAKAAT